jgi:pilus assembly protein CpaB
MKTQLSNKLRQLRRFRPGKTWVVLGVALTIGGLAALTASSYLSGKVAAIEARAKGATMRVVVAKTDIARGVKLDNQNLAVREVPVEYGHSVAVAPEDFQRIDGQAVAYPAKAGEMILWAMMETQRAPSFSSRVENGHRAMTVPVDEINSISGMLEPGDTIDLIATIEQNGKRRTFPLLQRMRVLATGQRSVDDPKSGERRSYSTVTLDTTPAQAQTLIVARDTGKLTALLRNPQDEQPISVAGNHLTALTGQDRPRRARRPIPVLYGASLAKMPADALRLPQLAPGAPAAAPAPRIADRAALALAARAGTTDTPSNPD